MKTRVLREQRLSFWRVSPVVDVPELGDSVHEMWVELFSLAAEPPAPWVLIGAQMVALHGWARGRTRIRPSEDADLLVNVRTVAKGTELMGRALSKRGYRFDGASPEGVGHRFRSGQVSLDVLGPDGLGPNTSLRVTAGAHTVEVPGGSQALKRAEEFTVQSRTMTGRVPIPSLLGAILVKVRAINVDDNAEAQRRDVAFLLSIVEDPESLGRDLAQSERKWLREHDYFAESSHQSYEGLAEAEDAAIVYRRLADVR